MKSERAYTVFYKSFDNDPYEEYVQVAAKTRAQAYHKVMKEYKPKSAYVAKVTYQNGKEHYFVNAFMMEDN